jgi:nicotinamidase-related amidase
LNREYLEKAELLTESGRSQKATLFQSILPKHSLLIAINTQKALRDPAMGSRSNSEAEKNILRLFAHWRKEQRPILHVKHVSENPDSFFYRHGPGVDFISGLEPKKTETILEKNKSSAFTGTNLEKFIRRIQPEALVLVGFTGGECIDATAKQAHDLGYKTFVIDDATASFDIVGPNGKLHKATKVHRNILANLHAHFAEVIETESALL